MTEESFERNNRTNVQLWKHQYQQQQQQQDKPYTESSNLYQTNEIIHEIGQEANDMIQKANDDDDDETDGTFVDEEFQNNEKIVQQKSNDKQERQKSKEDSVVDEETGFGSGWIVPKEQIVQEPKLYHFSSDNNNNNNNNNNDNTKKQQQQKQELPSFLQISDDRSQSSNSWFMPEYTFHDQGPRHYSSKSKRNNGQQQEPPEEGIDDNIETEEGKEHNKPPTRTFSSWVPITYLEKPTKPNPNPARLQKREPLERELWVLPKGYSLPRTSPPSKHKKRIQVETVLSKDSNDDGDIDIFHNEEEEEDDDDDDDSTIEDASFSDESDFKQQHQPKVKATTIFDKNKSSSSDNNDLIHLDGDSSSADTFSAKYPGPNIDNDRKITTEYKNKSDVITDTKQKKAVPSRLSFEPGHDHHDEMSEPSSSSSSTSSSSSEGSDASSARYNGPEKIISIRSFDGLSPSSSKGGDDFEDEFGEGGEKKWIPSKRTIILLVLINFLIAIPVGYGIYHLADLHSGDDGEVIDEQENGQSGGGSDNIFDRKSVSLRLKPYEVHQDESLDGNEAIMYVQEYQQTIIAPTCSDEYCPFACECPEKCDFRDEPVCGSTFALDLSAHEELSFHWDASSDNSKYIHILGSSLDATNDYPDYFGTVDFEFVALLECSDLDERTNITVAGEDLEVVFDMEGLDTSSEAYTFDRDESFVTLDFDYDRCEIYTRLRFEPPGSTVFDLKFRSLSYSIKYDPTEVIQREREYIWDTQSYAWIQAESSIGNWTIEAQDAPFASLAARLNGPTKKVYSVVPTFDSVSSSLESDSREGFEDELGEKANSWVILLVLVNIVVAVAVGYGIYRFADLHLLGGNEDENDYEEEDVYNDDDICDDDDEDVCDDDDTCDDTYDDAYEDDEEEDDEEVTALVDCKDETVARVRWAKKKNIILLD